MSPDITQKMQMTATTVSLTTPLSLALNRAQLPVQTTGQLTSKVGLT